MINDKHKDRVFKFLFGNPSNKAWTLNLYNAINCSHYDNPDDILFNTIEDVIYLGMRNDVSFLILDNLTLWEHQSSYNPNMPIRFFLYAAKLYEKFIADVGYYPHSSILQHLPCPRCICFYNGLTNQPEKVILKLSDAFSTEADIQVQVTMFNINYGKNKQLMDTCKPLNEYAWLVDKIRKYQKNFTELEEAIDKAIDDMPNEFVIKKFLLLNRAEVKGMFLTEWNQEKVLAQERQQERQEVEYRVATDMLKEKLPIPLIVKISKLSEDTILDLAKNIDRYSPSSSI